MGNEKIVRFDIWCQHCKHYQDDESDPNSKCWDCLDEPVNIDSKKPLYFEEETK